MSIWEERRDQLEFLNRLENKITIRKLKLVKLFETHKVCQVCLSKNMEEEPLFEEEYDEYLLICKDCGFTTSYIKEVK